MIAMALVASAPSCGCARDQDDAWEHPSNGLIIEVDRRPVPACLTFYAARITQACGRIFIGRVLVSRVQDIAVRGAFDDGRNVSPSIIAHGADTRTQPRRRHHHGSVGYTVQELPYEGLVALHCAENHIAIEGVVREDDDITVRELVHAEPLAVVAHF